MNNNKEITIEFSNNSLISIMLGNHSINLSRLEQLTEANIQTFGNQFKISGKDEHVKLAKAILTNVYDSISKERGKNIICEFSRFETELRMLKTDSNFHETIKTKSSFNSYKIDTWKKTITPFSAPAWPPDTGASNEPKPFSLANLLISLAIVAEAVVLSI